MSKRIINSDPSGREQFGNSVSTMWCGMNLEYGLSRKRDAGKVREK